MSNSWTQDVTTRPPATFPPTGTYTRTGKQIYLIMRSPEVSPNGLGSAIQMCVFYLNRNRKRLPAARVKAITSAIDMLRTELKFLRQWEKCDLENEPKSVFPEPPKELRIGGRFGYSQERYELLVSRNKEVSDQRKF